ncbi:inactive serine threonine- kinase TEX14 isoform X3 [Brachionus plicatilis]|uniref:Inactive serine threonine-kinase TEX14 isoform X3 n=1 Tax=Brachionus plicatilis TaxID=10195 RepID=A0A3M7SKQ8_BRAPC|nr:inactive serine threonine- kinase TEX14 isoform X3 [Brachionus plicatilis]
MADPTCSTSPLSQLHKFAYEGNKNKLKNLLKTEQNIDKLDQNGNTALYCACARGAKDCVKLLLEKSANPNERCQDNETPMHVAARYGHTKVLVLLLEYGGDLRLHDIHNRTPKTCAMQQENSALRRKTLALIEETRMNAQLQTNKTDAQKLSMLSITPKSRDELVNPCSVGFGILYKSTGEIGMPIFLPAIKENDLEHDYGGETFNNGAFMVYESMRWKELHVVTVKRLHSSIADQGHSDLLIEELKYFKKINHCPNILSIMGFCQYVNSEGLMLMFERVQVGSLFAVLHERPLSKRPKLKSICQIMMNVCDALIFLHQMNILHCYVSSHSIFLTNFHTAKLGNLEYAVEKSGDLARQRRTRVVENKMENCAYNWLAPEILENSIPTELSDMYSYCVVVWEMFECRIPWQSCDHIEIQHEMLIKGNMLPVDHEKIAFPFSRIVKDGFSNPIKRMGFEEVRGVLENYQMSLHSQSMSKVKLGRLYQRVPRAKANSVTGLETLNSDEVDKTSENSAEYIKCDAYRLLEEFYYLRNFDRFWKKIGFLQLFILKEIVIELNSSSSSSSSICSKDISILIN